MDFSPLIDTENTTTANKTQYQTHRNLNPNSSVPNVTTGEIKDAVTDVDTPLYPGN